MRILNISDLHIGGLEKEHTNYNVNILCKSIAKQYVDIAIVNGDVFHNANIGTKHLTTHECLDAFNTILDTIRAQLSCEIFIIKGNHDVVSGKDATFLPIKLDGVTIINNPIVLTYNGEKLAFWPWMYNGKYSLSHIMDSNATLFGHCLWKEIMWGSRYKSDAFNTFSTEELMVFNSAYLGHVHYRYSSDTVHYIGQPWHTRFFGNKAQEAAAVPGYAIIDTNNPNPIWIDIDTIKFIDCYTKEELDRYKDTNHKLSIHFIPTESIPTNATIAKARVVKEDIDVDSLDPATVSSVEDCWHYWCSQLDTPQDEIDLGDETIASLGIKTDLGRSVEPITRINKITAINLCNHSNYVLEPSDATVIKGNMGCGKTIILETALLALYGNTPTRPTMLSVLKDDETNGKAIIDFMSNDNHYIIERTITTDTGSSRTKSSQNAKIIKNGEEIKIQKSSDIDALIEQTFGPYDLAVATWFMCQRQVTGSMIGSTAANIERIMHNILGHDTLDDVYKSVSMQTNAHLKDLAKIESTVERLTNDLSGMPTVKELNARIKEYDNQNVDAIINARGKRDALRDAKALLSSISILKDEYAALVKPAINDKDILSATVSTIGLSKLENSLSTLQFEIDRDTKELNALQNRLHGEFEKRIQDEHCNGCIFLKSTKDTVESLSNRITANTTQVNTLHEPLANLIKVRPFTILLERNRSLVNKMIVQLCSNTDLSIQDFTVYDFVQMFDDMVYNLSIDVASLESEISSTNLLPQTESNTSPRDTLAILNNTTDALNKAKANLTIAEKKRDVLTSLRACFAPGGIPYRITSHVLPAINEALNELEVLLDLPFSIRLVQGIGRGGKPTFTFEAIVRGKKRDAGGGSGGEKLHSDICVRLAMLKLMNNSKVLVADEVYEGLHDTVRDSLVDILFNTGLIDQVILTTHIEVSTDAQIINL